MLKAKIFVTNVQTALSDSCCVHVQGTKTQLHTSFVGWEAKMHCAS